MNDFDEAREASETPPSPEEETPLFMSKPPSQAEFASNAALGALVSFIDGVKDDDIVAEKGESEASTVVRVDNSNAIDESVNSAQKTTTRTEFSSADATVRPRRSAHTAGKVKKTSSQTQRAALRLPKPYSASSVGSRPKMASLGEVQISLALTGL
jgi:hypothetical protein